MSEPPTDGPDEQDLEEEYDPEPYDPRKRREQEERQAWGSWRQDREKNRRKVLRSLVGLVIVSVLTALLAYGCDSLRGPREVRFNEEVAGYQVQPPTGETERLAGQLEAAGATGAAARDYRGPNDVLLLAGYSTELPVEVVGELLPPVVAGDIEYEGRGGPLTCGATADGSRCIWRSADLVGGTSARGVPPDALEKITRDLRAGAIRA